MIRYSEERKQRGKDEEDQIEEMPRDSFYCLSQKLLSNYFGVEDLRLYFPDTQYYEGICIIGDGEERRIKVVNVLTRKPIKQKCVEQCLQILYVSSQ